MPATHHQPVNSDIHNREPLPGRKPFLVPRQCSAEEIYVGVVFIKRSLALPPWFRFASQVCGYWNKIVQANSDAVELLALSQGWRFSYLAQVLEGRGRSWRADSALNRALSGLMEAVRRSGFNSFEITQVATRRRLGFQSVRIEAHPRQLWPGPFLRPLHASHYVNIAENFKPILWRASELQPEVRGI